MWYILEKLGQIWNVSYRRDSVQSCLEVLYQLTYKYQQMQIQQFKGYPTRQENMLKGIEKQARQVIADLVDLLLPVFETWLEGHALTNPRAWAENAIRIQNETGGDSPEAIAEMINEFSFGNESDRQKIDANFVAEQLDYPIKSGEAPAFARWFEVAKIELREADDENRDEFNTQPEDQIDEYYKNMDFSYYFSEYYGNDWTRFLEEVSKFESIDEFAIEMAQFGLFKAWYEYWQQQGIDETRSRIENAHQMLKQVESQPIQQALATINIVINTCHQTGDMLDYIVAATNDYKGELYRAMNNLSSLTDNSPEMQAWNEQLLQVGTQIPRSPKAPTQPEQNIIPRTDIRPPVPIAQKPLN